jgi:hypothetical protein
MFWHPSIFLLLLPGAVLIRNALQWFQKGAIIFLNFAQDVTPHRQYFFGLFLIRNIRRGSKC